MSAPALQHPAQRPKGLVDALSAKPYVEQSCTDTTWAGWPHEAKKCTYKAGPLTTTATTATPSAERVACWIAESSSLIPALHALEKTDPAAWEKGLVHIGKVTVLYQSSRIFPLEGGIIEDMGGGYVNYPFSKGVTEGCSTGCYCRINSLHRTDWCAYVAATGGTYDGCIAQVGASGLTKGWGNECLQNHIDAWQSDVNHHFRAKAFALDKIVKQTCPTAGGCSSAQVLKAPDGALN